MAERLDEPPATPAAPVVDHPEITSARHAASDHAAV
jgi:hypothetical protein